MKKIPTLFVREFCNGKIIGITDKITPNMEWVLEGEGDATIKYDGACCATIGGELYKRYDAKRGKQPPAGAIPCCDPDPVTGHWPHWVKCDENNPADKWFLAAMHNSLRTADIEDGTWEAVGLHFQGNPYKLPADTLIRHGEAKIEVERNFYGIRRELETRLIEGIVFWKDGEPRCKIKRTDFGLPWPVLMGEQEGAEHVR